MFSVIGLTYYIQDKVIKYSKYLNDCGIKPKYSKVKSGLEIKHVELNDNQEVQSLQIVLRVMTNERDHGMECWHLLPVHRQPMFSESRFPCER